MLQIILESEYLEPVKGFDCYVDYILEDGYMYMALDLRSYDGPRNKCAIGVDVMLCALEDVPKVFNDKTEESGGAPYDWAGYCSYINTNAA